MARTIKLYRVSEDGRRVAAGAFQATSESDLQVKWELHLATAVGGLRMRTRPGLDRLVTTVLGPDVGLLIGLGPVFVDGQGWYLVRDPDRTVPPRFNEGWVAAGFEPDPAIARGWWSGRDVGAGAPYQDLLTLRRPG